MTIPPASTGYADVESVTKGETDHHVVVTFRRRFVDWPKLFAPLYPASTNRSATLWNGGWKTQPLVSAEPQVGGPDLHAQLAVQEDR